MHAATYMRIKMQNQAAFNFPVCSAFYFHYLNVLFLNSRLPGGRSGLVVVSDKLLAAFVNATRWNQLASAFCIAELNFSNPRLFSIIVKIAS